ncbi:plasmid partitioning protein RepB [uncultured Roseibium sp.]|uniref:plasmid partitioning protein RepB n=1 Tax=uncultured Roseibium sp. TaxID=1936171 RepID=UPI002627F03A|nr:plasmid partitioning protein RepB [uncultured Roseibium sp.]
MKKSILTKLQKASRSGLVDTPIPRRPLKSSPVVSSATKALSELAADTVIQLDPKKLHPSPYRDRMVEDQEAVQSLAELRNTIELEGQKIPVLARPHPDVPGEFQLAYGHRRWKAILQLVEGSPTPEKVFIRAHVRDLSDDELIREQSLENGVRENLSWIEKAHWAVQLKQAGIKQRDMAPVLGASEADVSRYFKITDSLPSDVVFKIGRAKDAGRPKWMKLLDLYEKSTASKKRITEFLDTGEFSSLSASDRLDAVISVASSSRTGKGGKPSSVLKDYSVKGLKICSVETTRAGKNLKIPAKETEFADWLVAQIGDLYLQFELDQKGEG